MDEKRARELLESERRRLQDLKDSFELSNLSSETEQASVDELSSVDQHPADLGTETFEREKRVSVLASVDDELADIEHALSLLGKGRYGRCQVCGKEIPEERLEARPGARYCLEHQAEVERGVRDRLA